MDCLYAGRRFAFSCSDVVQRLVGGLAQARIGRRTVESWVKGADQDPPRFPSPTPLAPTMNKLTTLLCLTLLLCAARRVEGAPFQLPSNGTLVTHDDQGSVLRVSTPEGGRQICVSQDKIFNAALHRVPGHPAVGVSWSQGVDAPRRFYSVSVNGLEFTPPTETGYQLLLRAGHFDPLRDEAPAVIERRRGSELYIVQYWTQALEAYRVSVRATGARIHRYLPEHSNVVQMNTTQLEQVRALPFVRWVGPFHTDYKLDEGLLDPANPLWGLGDRARLNILTMVRGLEGQQPVAAVIEAIGGDVHSLTPQTYLMSATLTRAQALQVAHLDGVQWLDAWSAPENDMNIARKFHGSDYVESVGNYLGQGVQVEVLDGGCDTNHPDLQNYKVHKTNSASSHGTSTSGIICGSGAGNAAARGAMPMAKLVIADYAALGNRYTHTSELQAAPYKCVLQSNSWGGSRTLNYTSTSQNMDLILFDHSRISILQSQSNAGDQMSRPEAWAKNIISVGASYHQNTQTKNDDKWNFGASIGPAADGRIKPDLSSFYDATLTTTLGGGYTSSFGGTSGATPIIAGHLGLFYQMWSDGLFGNSAPGATVYSNRPENTTAKAVLINTATMWTFSGTNHDLTRTHQGWGHADLKTLYDLRDRMFVVDETDVLTETASQVYAFTVDGADPFKATLVFRDWPGTTSASQHRVNNLDLKVTDPAGNVYWGNKGLKKNMWSTSGGKANTIDTVENVQVENPSVGTWTVEVIASEINQDAHVETGAVDTDFALVVSGIDPQGGGLGTNYCTAIVNSSGQAGSLSGTGSATVSQNDLTLTAASLPPNQFGYILASQTQGLSVSPPGSMGNLCLGGTIARFSSQLMNSGASGTFSVPIDLQTIPLSPPVAIQPGETWNFTAWFRDNVLGPTSNFTDGLSITFN